mmetsp:Transcript_31947/g.59484  ORF Transcript_31947/g.59484 Transcript_31947/m.59484 type:complete len:160 (-) Transcript_31947:166-645(-)
MMPADHSCWPDDGEIDIMEMINGDGAVHSTYHWSRLHPLQNCTGSTGNTAIGNSLPLDTWDTEFHEYAVEWDGQSYVAFFLDGKPVVNVSDALTLAKEGYTETEVEARPQFSGSPFYMILNTALGGPWPKPVTAKTMLPVYHTIDSVVVAQKPPPAGQR